MIRPKRLNCVGIVVRDLQASLVWYKQHFGFEKLFDVSNGVVIGADGVELWLAQADDPDNAKRANTKEDICIRLLAFEVSPEDLAHAETEFSQDKDIVWIDHPRYESCIIEDLDGHSIELYVDKPVPPPGKAK